MATPPISVTPASPETSGSSGVANRRLSYQPADSGPHRRAGSTASSSPYPSAPMHQTGGGYGSTPQPHIRTGSLPYVPDAPSR